MKFINLSGPQDVMALLVRRKWWIVLPFVGLAAAVIVTTAILPQMYVSQNLVIIRPRDVPEEFVKDLIAGTTAERLSVLSERVLSETNLKRVLGEFQSELPEYRHLNAQDQIAKLRTQVQLQFAAREQLKAGQLPISAFRIVCKNQNPIMAQKIVKRLTDVFLEADRSSREANVNDTAKFLQQQVDEIGEKLKESDSKLKQLKSRRRDELPTQLDSNLRRLENLISENQGLRRDRTTYVLAQSALEQQLSDTPKENPKPTAPLAPAAAKDPKVEEYRSILKEVKTIKSKAGVTENHPDMVRVNLYLRRLEEDMTPEQIALAKEDPPLPGAATETDAMQKNPAYLTLERNIEILKKQVESIDESIAQNEKAIGVYNEHVNNTPQGEQELTDVLRENNDLSKQYQDMSAKLIAARLSERAENRQKGTQFEMVDSASLPLTPTKPAKITIMIAGITLSLLIALALAFTVEIANQKSWSQSDIAYLIGVKVLVEIPRMTLQGSRARSRKERATFLAAVAAGSSAYAVCLYLAYNHAGFVLRRLDPLLQKLY